jgi:uncharacterized cofD-like protein
MSELNDKSIVVMGGGTGSYNILKTLKNYSSDITALVNMIDDGGSSGILRDEQGVLPPGDIRQCLVALSEAPQNIRDLFNYRFRGKGSLYGHSFGNLFLSAVELSSQDFNQAIQLAADFLRIKGKVIPITLTNSNLIMTYRGIRYRGETYIGQVQLKPKESIVLDLDPPAMINDLAQNAILKSDLIIIAPGDIFRSILPNFIVKGVKKSLERSRAKLVVISNIMNKKTTAEYRVEDYIKLITSYCGRPVDLLLVNNKEPSNKQLKKYALLNEYPISYNCNKLDKLARQVVYGNYLNYLSKQENDYVVEKSLIRHNSVKVIETIKDNI